MIHIFQIIHCGIEVVQVFVPEQMVVYNVPLPARVMERIVISCSREVQPLKRISVKRASF